MRSQAFFFLIFILILHLSLRSSRTGEIMAHEGSYNGPKCFKMFIFINFGRDFIKNEGYQAKCGGGGSANNGFGPIP